MRRTDREVTDPAEIDRIIRSCEICRLGFFDGEEVYIVPLNFGYTVQENGKRCFYFHGAKEGRKLELIRRAPSVGFELDCGYRPIDAETACGHSSQYQSVIGTGIVRLLEDSRQKNRAMQSLMERVTGRRDWELPDEAMKRVAVFELEIQKLSCKVHA